VIAAWQADRAGIAPARMRSLVRNGRWQQLHFGVYATFTGAVPRDAVMWAALLRAGPPSVLSHETAAEVSGLLDRRSRLLHVTVPESRRVRPVPGMVIHRSSNLIQARQPGVLPPRTLVEEVGGLHTLRYGWADVTERACETAAQVATLLARQGWPGPLRRGGAGRGGGFWRQ
jgi:hypothetical protein